MADITNRIPANKGNIATEARNAEFENRATNGAQAIGKKRLVNFNGSGTLSQR